MCSSLQAPKNFSYHQRYCYVIENRLDTWIPGYQHTHSPGFEFVTKSIALFLFCFFIRTHNSAHFDDCCTDLLQIYKNQSCAENFSDVFFLSFFLLFFFPCDRWLCCFALLGSTKIYWHVQLICIYKELWNISGFQEHGAIQTTTNKPINALDRV